MPHEVIIVMISCEEKSYTSEYSSDDMISFDFFPETYEYDDIDREYEYSLPPAKYANI